ncbi:MAG TPA: hypothetical protein GX736_01160 [Mogibacterium sp.]|nr:hypothetical protein [Mogibacterium sp.]
MINELRQLSIAMEKASISAESWHRKYKLIPNVNANNPCLQIVFFSGEIKYIRSVSKEQAATIRKYGSNQGTFPGLNLVPLYRITDENIKKEIRELKDKAINEEMLKKIELFCNENNWNEKFLKKYRISMESVSDELNEKIKNKESCRELFVLMKEVEQYRNPQKMRDALENAAFEQLRQNDDVQLALQVLFHLGSERKDANEDTGTLSTILDCENLIETGYSTTGMKFTKKINAVLLESESEDEGEIKKEEKALDAFGELFIPVEEPMPSVKLAGGIDVTLRTMFREQRCQERYGRIENASYPISPGMRISLQSALTWIGSAEHRDKMWINVDKDEILFAYPYILPEVQTSYVRAFINSPRGNSHFEAEAKKLVEELNKTRIPGTLSNANRLRIFILKKIDKARTKVIYTRVTDPVEIKSRSEVWTLGCRNIPESRFGEVEILFPLRIADILNRVWKQDGTIATDKFKPVPKYHGIELLFERDEPVTRDLYMLVQASVTLAPYLGAHAHEKLGEKKWWNVKDMLSLMGMMLYRVGIRKEQYMNKFPYQYGQLLKVSDELHTLYCNVVRKGEVPPQLAGSGLYQTAVDSPVRALRQLGQRMNPYITWAKYYRTKNVPEEGKESWRAGWLLALYEKIANALYAEWMCEENEQGIKVKFNDAEKAQLFIGYLASFPKNEKKINEISDENEELLNENKEEENE